MPGPLPPLPFWKMHGLGNDFVLFDARGGLPVPRDQVTDFARTICDRHTGLGSDGVIFLESAAPPPEPPADARMRILNPDGSEAEMCGNGIRCLAGLARVVAFPERTGLRIQTRAGLREVRFTDDGDPFAEGVAEVSMGTPRLRRADIPATGAPDALFLDEVMTAGGHDYAVTCLSMGNPHCVLFLDAQRGTPLDGVDLAEVPLDILGPLFAHHPHLPQGANVEFATVVDRDEIAVRVWERGAGATQACGTGACAVMVAAHLTGRCGRRACIHLPGGSLQVAWDGDGPVQMTGPYTWICRGEWLGGLPPSRDGVR